MTAKGAGPVIRSSCVGVDANKFCFPAAIVRVFDFYRAMSTLRYILKAFGVAYCDSDGHDQ